MSLALKLKALIEAAPAGRRRQSIRVDAISMLMKAAANVSLLLARRASINIGVALGHDVDLGAIVIIIINQVDFVAGAALIGPAAKFVVYHHRPHHHVTLLT